MAAAECRGSEEMSSFEQRGSGEGYRPRSWKVKLFSAETGSRGAKEGVESSSSSTGRYQARARTRVELKIRTRARLVS
ncbi:hypothetical protein KFK09_011344 [Dendrobium nobile]|uniref:Uncharacterized protein n=1 Tax=Dendrobium nobile TaxID=94219 RepID=A0A8T3BFP1_DENNO|nr:hypothetical protein KFK09_011344 [Dendrobium nobile]